MQQDRLASSVYSRAVLILLHGAVDATTASQTIFACAVQLKPDGRAHVTMSLSEGRRHMQRLASNLKTCIESTRCAARYLADMSLSGETCNASLRRHGMMRWQLNNGRNGSFS